MSLADGVRSSSVLAELRLIAPARKFCRYIKSEDEHPSFPLFVQGEKKESRLIAHDDTLSDFHFSHVLRPDDVNRRSNIGRVSSNFVPRPIKYRPQFPRKLGAIDSATSCGTRREHACSCCRTANVNSLRTFPGYFGQRPLTLCGSH